MSRRQWNKEENIASTNWIKHTTYLKQIKVNDGNDWKPLVLVANLYNLVNAAFPNCVSC